MRNWEMIKLSIAKCGKNSFDVVFKVLMHQMLGGTEENTVKPQYSLRSNYHRMFSHIKWNPYLKFLRLKSPLLKHPLSV